MAINYLSPVDFNKQELRGVVIQKLAIAPSSPSVGQIYYDTGDETIYMCTDDVGPTWVSLGGDITEVIAGTGLAGGGDTGAVTLSLGTSGVTAATYGSSTEIPVVTVDQYGRITTATTASISTTLTVAADSGSGDGVSLATDTFTIAGTANEIETSISGDTVTIGLPNDVTIGNNLVVSGNLTVSGTTTTVNTETINLADNIITLNSNATGSATEDAGIEVERGDDTNVSIIWDESAAAWTFTNDGSTFYNIPDSSDIDDRITAREYATSIGNGADQIFQVTHNLGTRDVIVQLFDNGSYDTVYADVERTTTNTVDITFGVVPSTNDIRVLITKIG